MEPTLPPPPDSAGVSMDVGARLRNLRVSFGLSQRELAKRAGITNATISLIEQNRVSPSIASLKRVLSGFPLSLAEFFSEDRFQRGKIVYRAEELIEMGGDKVSLRQIETRNGTRALQMLHERYLQGGDTGNTMLSHSGEEAGIVVRGRIELTVGDETHVLESGDAYYFESRLPHRFRNLGSEPCEIVSVCTPPSF